MKGVHGLVGRLAAFSIDAAPEYATLSLPKLTFYGPRPCDSRGIARLDRFGVPRGRNFTSAMLGGVRPTRASGPAVPLGGGFMLFPALTIKQLNQKDRGGGPQKCSYRNGSNKTET